MFDYGDLSRSGTAPILCQKERSSTNDLTFHPQTEVSAKILPLLHHYTSLCSGVYAEDAILIIWNTFLLPSNDLICARIFFMSGEYAN